MNRNVVWKLFKVEYHIGEDIVFAGIGLFIDDHLTDTRWVRLSDKSLSELAHLDGRTTWDERDILTAIPPTQGLYIGNKDEVLASVSRTPLNLRYSPVTLHGMR